jgi:hypothetical protein
MPRPRHDDDEDASVVYRNSDDPAAAPDALAKASLMVRAQSTYDHERSPVLSRAPRAKTFADERRLLLEEK